MLFILAFFMPAAAEVKFKDIPADHWAARSVYNLVKLGITNGYPDGTFRGSKNITRYETAIFLSKLAEKMGAGNASQIKEDLEAIKNDIAALKKTGKPPVIRGSFEMNSMFTNLLAVKGISGKGPIINYRLKTGIEKDLNESASIKVNLDTMDAGFYGGVRDLAKDMIDWEGKLKLNPVDLGVVGDILFAPVEVKFTAGPGIVQHFDLTGIATSENGICYLRPKTGLIISSKLGEFSVSGSYLISNYDRDDSGKVNTNYGALTLGWAVRNLTVEATGGFYAKNPNSGGPRDSKVAVNLSSEINQKVSTNASLSISGSEKRSWMAGAVLSLSNFIEGASLTVAATKIGADFIPADLIVEELGETGFDIFMRPLENSTANLNFEFLQALTDKIIFKSKGAWRLTPDFGYGPDKQKSRQTIQAGFSYLPARDMSIDAYYRANQDPTIGETTDLSAISINYRF